MPRSFAPSLVLFAALAFAAACSAPDAKGALVDGNCPPVNSKLCQNDELLTQKQVDECETAKSDNVCGSAYVDFLKCEGTSLQCDSGGHSPSPASACASQEAAYLSCTSGRTSTDGGS